jgi:sugar-specific transcriptional regulator TrmB
MNRGQNMGTNSHINKNDLDKEKIVEDFVKLGFTLNDARVYLSLLYLGPNKPVKISEDCGVDRSRVYDSLRRLSKKGYVTEEPVKRSPLYRAKNPAEILNNIRKEFREKEDLSLRLEKSLENIQPNNHNPFLVSLYGVESIYKQILMLIYGSEKYIQFIITPDLSMNSEYLSGIVNALVEKKDNNPEIKIEVALNPKEGEIQFFLKRLYESRVSIYLWYVGNVLPFGLYLSERTYIFTTLDVGKVPSYDIGLTIENSLPGMTEGFRQLFAFHNASYFIQGKMKHYSKTAQANSDDSKKKISEDKNGITS